jgi:hypothetical protein
MRVLGTEFDDRLSRDADQAWLDSMLQETHLHLPRMLREHHDPVAFWHWFRGETDSLLRLVHDDAQRRYLEDRINAMLEDVGVPERFGSVGGPGTPPRPG